MGLDMYLYKTKKVNNFDPVEHLAIYKKIDRILNKVDDLDDTCNIYTIIDGVLDDQLITLTPDDLKQFHESYKERGKYLKWYSIWENVGYWRKANAIHNWFVDVIQDSEDDCDMYYVEQEQLIELKELCEYILENKNNPNYDPSTDLPTTEGFFFGNTDYTEYYYSDIEETIEIINNILKTTNFDTDFICYQSSW